MLTEATTVYGSNTWSLCCSLRVFGASSRNTWSFNRLAEHSLKGGTDIVDVK
jgi:hypothetical protein